MTFVPTLSPLFLPQPCLSLQLAEGPPWPPTVLGAPFSVPQAHHTFSWDLKPQRWARGGGGGGFPPLEQMRTKHEGGPRVPVSTGPPTSTLRGRGQSFPLKPEQVPGTQHGSIKEFSLEEWPARPGWSRAASPSSDSLLLLHNQRKQTQRPWRSLWPPSPKRTGLALLSHLARLIGAFGEGQVPGISGAGRCASQSAQGHGTASNGGILMVVAGPHTRQEVPGDRSAGLLGT